MHSRPSTSCLQQDNRIILNVSGASYETYEKTLQRFPETLLGDSNKRKDFFQNGEYFFNRSRIGFDSILFFYQSFGRLARPANLPMPLFENECRYFEIPEEIISSMKEKEGYLLINKNNDEDEDEGDQTPTTFLQKAYYVIEYPDSSKIATIFSIISVSATVASVLLACIESIPSIRRNHRTSGDPLFIIDVILTVWFAFEVTARIISSPSLCQVFTSPMMYVEFMGSYPYLIVVVIGNNDPQLRWLIFFRIFRLFKLTKLLKLFTSSKKVELLGKILYSSLPDVGLLIICLLIIVFLGATLMYLLESPTDGTLFTSIPSSTWWALQTVVVLGYGDMVPETTQGKILAASFMIFGAVTLALPVLSVGTKFITAYEVNLEEEET